MRITALVILMLSAAATGFGRQGAAALDMTKLQTVTGAVTAVDIGYGMQYPSITVNKLQIKMAPVWYLLEKGFEVKVGDPVSVVAAPSTLASDGYLYAIEATNTASKLRIVLRDSAGLPEWSGGRGRRSGPMAEGGCYDPASAATVSGTVDKVSMGVGIQMPTLTLKAASGQLMVFKLGPERVLLEADLELKHGDTLTVKYAAAACTDELVALALTTSSGRTIVLRDDDCGPAWR